MLGSIVFRLLSRAALLAALLLFAAGLVPQSLGLPGFLPGFLAGAGVAKGLDRETLSIVTKNGEVVLTVEVARTERDKALGLMFRQHLDVNTGMLFPYDEASDLTMWMRNTYIPLDMIFIRPDGRIARIARNTEPFSEEIISAGVAVSAVLEIGGGEATRLGIEVGDEVRHAHFAATAER